MKTQQANLEAAKANLDAARVARDNTALVLKRDTELIQQQILDQNSYDSAKADADTAAAKVEQATAAVRQAEAQLDTIKADQEQARAQIQQAQAELNKAKVNLAYCDIVSPVDGMTDVAQAAQQTSQVMTLLLGSIAAVSLLVGGIGIMNVMLVSVTERTREIGICMAVGARPSYIKEQFLTESVALSLVGGLIGVMAGAGLAVELSKLLAWPTLVSPASALVSFGFAALVGIFFGYYPAARAASLDPIEALRYQ